MSFVPPEKREVARGAHTLVVNVGAVLSIAFVLAMVTTPYLRALCSRYSPGSRGGFAEGAAVSFIAGFHAELWFVAGASLVGAVFSALRDSERRRASST